MIELEDIVPRRDYKLALDWNCSKCGCYTKMLGCILPNEPPYKHHDQYGRDSLVTWDDLLHKNCRCGNIEKPVKKCSRCGLTHNFDSFGCKPCDDRIKQILILEEDCIEFKDRIRKLKRRKDDTTQLEYELNEILKKLNSLDVIACTQCGVIWLSRGQICRKCNA